MKDVQVRFDDLATIWEEETRHLSSAVQAAEHPAYQAIIALGEPAVPLILVRLKDKSINYWFIALEAITGENPVSKSRRGYPAAMTIDWLLWGLRRGMLRAA